MKRIFTALAAISISSTALAQLPAYPISCNVKGYILPQTVVEVSVVQEREVIIRGPYARYASQYLGVSGAPMVDKESFKIISAELSYKTEPDLERVYATEKTSYDQIPFVWLEPTAKLEDVKRTDAEFEGADLQNYTPFKDVATGVTQKSNSRLQVGRNSAIEKSEEQMAADAANVIFKIRSRRLELICGEQGEYVFGEGLQAALNEMDKIEEEYVSLFLGKRYTQQTVHTFEVVPDVNSARVVAFRFTAEKGVTSADNLVASPVNMEFAKAETPQEALKKAAESKPSKDKKKTGKTMPYRVPENTVVKLWDGITTFDTETIPIYQKSKIQELPIVNL